MLLKIRIKNFTFQLLFLHEYNVKMIASKTIFCRFLQKMSIFCKLA